MQTLKLLSNIHKNTSFIGNRKCSYTICAHVCIYMCFYSFVHAATATVYIICGCMYKGVDVFLFASSGILAYRVFRNDRKLYIKILHASMHVAALIFASVGLKAVFDSHNNSGNANLYSLHSWLGLTVVIAFGLQVCLHHKIFIKFILWKDQTNVFVFPHHNQLSNSAY